MSGSKRNVVRVGVTAAVLLLLPAVGRTQCNASFTYQTGDPAPLPASQVCVLTAGSVAMNYAASASAGWIQVSPAAGSIQATGSANLMISVSVGGLSVGSYGGTITITAPGYQDQVVRVYLAIVSPVPQTPTVSANPASLAFVYQRGGARPVTQSISVYSSGAAVQYTASVVGAAWLTISGALGATPGTVTALVDPTGLADGTYTAQVVIQASGSANGSAAVTVSLGISTPAPLTLSQNSLSFGYAIGDPRPTPQLVSVGGSPTGVAFNVAIDAASVGWLQFSTNSSQTPATLAVTVLPDQLPPGAYQGTIYVTLFGSGNRAQIQVNLNVAGTISFTYQPGADPPAPKCFSMGDATGPATVLSTSPSPWFSVSTAQGGNPPSTCVSVAAQNLAQGDYAGTITMSLNQLVLSVVLHVLPPPSLVVSPNVLNFGSQLPGSPMLPQLLSITSTNPASGAQFNVSISPNTPWLQASVQSGSTPARLTLTPDTHGMQAGTYTATVTITVAGVTTGAQTVAVTLQVPTPVTVTLKAQPSLIARPVALSFVYESKFALPAQQTIRLSGGETSVTASATTASGGSWLAVSPSQATTPSAVSVSVVPQGLAPGTYQGAIQVDASGSSFSSVTVPVTLTVTATAIPIVSPASLTLEAQAGAGKPASGHLIVNTSGDILFVSVTTTGGPWLSVNPTVFQVGQFDMTLLKVVAPPQALTVVADASGLTAGTYNGSILVAQSDGSAAVTVPVAFTVRANTLTVSQIADGANWKTSLFLVNTDWDPAPFTIRFRSPDGTPLVLPLVGIGSVSEYKDTIPVGGSRSIQTQGTDSNLLQGWAEVAAGKSLGGTAVFRQHLTDGDSEAAIPVSSPIGKQFSLPFDNSQGFVTAMAAVNPGVPDSTVSVTIHDEDGQLLGTDALTTKAETRQAFALDQQFAETAGRRGVITLSNSTSAMAGFGLRFSPREAFTSIQAVPQVSAASGVTTRSIPQVADGGGWKTTIILVNPTQEPAPFSLAFRQADGSPLRLPLTGLGPTFEDADVIPSGGARTIETDGTSATLLQGWAEIVSTKPVMGTAVFRQRNAAGIDSEGAVQLITPVGDRLVMPFDNTQGFVTALAVLNESPSDALPLGVTVRDESGRTISNTSINLQPQSRQAFAMPDQFPQTQNLSGTVEFSGAQFSVLGLRFNPRGSFTSIAPLSK